MPLGVVEWWTRLLDLAAQATCECCHERPIFARGILWIQTGEQIPFALCARCTTVYQHMIRATHSPTRN